MLLESLFWEQLCLCPSFSDLIDWVLRQPETKTHLKANVLFSLVPLLFLTDFNPN